MKTKAYPYITIFSFNMLNLSISSVSKKIFLGIFHEALLIKYRLLRDYLKWKPIKYQYTKKFIDIGQEIILRSAHNFKVQKFQIAKISNIVKGICTQH